MNSQFSHHIFTTEYFNNIIDVNLLHNNYRLNNRNNNKRINLAMGYTLENDRFIYPDLNNKISSLLNDFLK